MIRQWRALEDWIEATGISRRKFEHGSVRLRDILSRRVARIDKEVRPLDTLNVIAKVTFGGKLFLRSAEQKRGYKGPLFEALPSDLIISKIRVGQGSLCVIESELDHVAVSPEYPVYQLDAHRIDADFLELVLRTPEFMAELAGRASGNTTKRRIRPESFESCNVPLPALERQRSITAAYRAALDQAASLEADSAETEARAAETFETALGLRPPDSLPDVPIFAARFRNIDRWSHDGILRSMLQAPDSEPRFAPVSLRSVGEVSYGLQKSPSNRPASHARPYLRVANVQRWRLALDEIKFIDVPDKDMPKYKLEAGDILLCEGNSPDLVGRGAIWHNEIADCVHQNHVIRVRLDAARALPEFVLSVINSRYGQAYFRSKAKRTTNLASINSKEVAGFPLPLPSPDEQRALIDALFASRNEASKSLDAARQIRARAWAEFEAAVYSSDRDPGVANSDR